LFSPCTPLECRTVSRMLVFGGMARFDELAHLPFHHLGKLYGSICFLRVRPFAKHWKYPWGTPLECRTVSRMLVFGGMARFDELAHLPFHHLGK
jgi:hypothetical protein